MDPDRRKAVGDAIRGRVKNAINQEVVDRLVAAVEAASAAGMEDEEIVEYVRVTLRKRARARQLANALKYRAGPASPRSGSRDGSS
jgi:hypothetical protein